MDSFKTGTLINERRKEKGLTQNEFAQMLGISNDTVSEWENGDGFPDITLLQQIAEILGITTDEILAGERKAVKENNEAQIKFEAIVPQTIKNYETVFNIARYSKTPKWTFIALFLCSIILLIVSYSMHLPNMFLPIFTVVLTILILSTAKIQALLQIARSKEYNGGELKDEIVKITDDKTIIIQINNGGRQYDLSHITGFYEKNDLFILRFHKRIYAYIPKDSFTVGSCDEFAQYIRENMTVKQDKKASKTLANILTVVLITLTVMTMFIAGIANHNSKNTYSYDDYIEMNTNELSALDDENLYLAISARTGEKKYYNEQPLNDYENTFYVLDDFIVEYENGGFCQYLYYLDDTKLDGLYKAFSDTQLTELSQQVKTFSDENAIDPMNFNSKVDYDMLYNKYPFKEFDKSIKHNCEDIEDALITYVRNNIESF